MLIIPAIDLMDGRCVRLRQGDYGRSTTYAVDPLDQALSLESAGFRRLHLVDLEAARSGAGANRDVILKLRRAVSLPIEVGGGVRCAADVEELLEARIDRLILGTVFLESPRLVEAWVARWGSEPFIASLDLRDGRLRQRGWIEESPLSVAEALRRVEGLGLQEVICTDILSDGSLRAPRYATYEKLLGLLPPSVGLIAAEGVSHPRQVGRLRSMGLAGAVVGRALYEGGHALEEWADAG